MAVPISKPIGPKKAELGVDGLKLPSATKIEPLWISPCSSASA